MHHTKTKGDIGVAKVISDLMEKDIVPCIPLSEHQHFDLIAITNKNNIYRLQVKYSKLKKGVIPVKIRSTWIDNNGSHSKYYNINDFDYYAVYCPDVNKVFYIKNGENIVSLRVIPTKNNQKKNVNNSVDYEILPE
jgi:hypothetical protein